MTSETAQLDTQPLPTATLPLTLPERTTKPRQTGLTMVIDSGLPVRQFTDIVSSYANLIDFVKFGWGTSLVDLSVTMQKIHCLQDHGVEFYFGGTLFERAVAEDLLQEYFTFCCKMGAAWLEVSDGTITLAPQDKAAAIREARAAGFSVLSEVGYKDAGRADELSPQQWAEAIHEDLESGAAIVITESRESGSVGLADASGEVRHDILDAIEAYGISTDQLLFEAPTKSLQIELIQSFGSNVNLGNIAPADIVALETLRLGLRSDTLLDMLPR